MIISTKTARGPKRAQDRKVVGGEIERIQNKRSYLIMCTMYFTLCIYIKDLLFFNA